MRKIKLSKTLIESIPRIRGQGVYYNTKLETMIQLACFGELPGKVLRSKSKGIYFGWFVFPESKLKPISLIKDLKRLFKESFIITPYITEKEGLYIIHVKPRDINKAFRVAGYNLIGTFLRAMDLEYYSRLWKDYAEKDIITIKDVIEQFYKSIETLYGHGINDMLYIKRNNKNFIEEIETYLYNIKTVFGDKEYDLSNEKLGIKYYESYYSGHGYNFAYNLVERLIRGELK